MNSGTAIVLACICAIYAVFAIYMEQPTQPATGVDAPTRTVFSEQHLAHIATMNLDEICKYGLIAIAGCGVNQVGDKFAFKDLDVGPIIKRMRQLLRDMPGLSPLPELAEWPPVSKEEIRVSLRMLTGILVVREALVPTIELPCGGDIGYLARAAPDIAIYSKLNDLINSRAIKQLC